MKKIIILLILIAFSSISNAATVTYNLEWDAVTLNADGSPCTDLAGYFVHTGESSGNYNHMFFAENVTETSGIVRSSGQIEVPDDAVTTIYFAVSAYDNDGLKSETSNEVSHEYDTRTVPAPPQHLKWWEKIISWIKSHWRFWV